MWDINSNDFTKEVQKELIELGKKKKDLALKLGISNAYLSDILNGHRKGEKIRKKIVELLGKWE